MKAGIVIVLVLLVVFGVAALQPAEDRGPRDYACPPTDSGHTTVVWITPYPGQTLLPAHVVTPRPCWDGG